MVQGEGFTPELEKHLHKLIKKVTSDIDSMKFNTAIAAMMATLNTVYEVGHITKDELAVFTKLLSPFAPHLAEEIYSYLGYEGLICCTEWPVWEPAPSEINAVIQSVCPCDLQYGSQIQIPLCASLPIAFSGLWLVSFFLAALGLPCCA